MRQSDTGHLSQAGVTRAREIGFGAAGVVRVEPMDPAPLRVWLEAGYSAEMGFLERHLPLRGDLRAVLPGGAVGDLRAAAVSRRAGG